MQNKTTKNIAIIIIASMILVFVLREFLKIMNASIESYPPFVYKTGLSTAAKKQRWYNYIEPLAKTVGAEYGIPWQAMMVQTALETGWGKSTALKYNNFSGVKDTDGQNVHYSPTQEFINGKWITITDGFETWKTPLEGLRGYAKFIHNNKRYQTALKFQNDPYRYITELRNAGYATSPNYISILHGMLKNDLKA